MDGIHDLGGMEGFGPVKATFDQNPFPGLEDWEKTMWGLSRTIPVEGMTIDWFRHVVERMVPKDYISYPYFNKWCATFMVLLVDNGVAAIGEFPQHRTEERRGAPSNDAVQKTLDLVRQRDNSFQKNADVPAKFRVDQGVRTRKHMASPHTRLPRYARGATGVVIAHHGCHPLPDLSARGTEEPEHLYTVKFDAQTLWGPDANPRDTVSLDLWESYLVPA